LAPRLSLEPLHFFGQRRVFSPHQAALLLHLVGPVGLRSGGVAQEAHFSDELCVVVL
jgi:hypothetical protein